MYVCIKYERARLIKGGTELLLKPKCIVHCGQDCNRIFYARLHSCGKKNSTISTKIPKHVFRLARVIQNVDQKKSRSKTRRVQLQQQQRICIRK